MPSWKEAINAIKNSDNEWIEKNHVSFKSFFRSQNVKETGALSKNSMAEHEKQKLFKMYLGAKHNGAALALNEGAQMIENAARLDGNWGWLLAIGVGGAYFADYMELETAHEFFDPANALVAGSGMPSGEAEKIDDEHFRINGSWSFCSGCAQASMMTCVVQYDNAICAVVVPAEEMLINEDWNGIGMQYTCSHSVKLETVQVHKNQFFDLSKAPRETNYPLAKYPFMLFAQVCFAPVVAGIAYSIFLVCAHLLGAKKEKWNRLQPERTAYIEVQINDFYAGWDKRKTKFYTVVEKSWNAHLSGADIAAQQVEDIALVWAEFSYDACAHLLPYMGMTAIDREALLQRMWCNLQTAFQHSSLRKYPKTTD